MKANYKVILGHERRWANAVARLMKKQKTISVWEVIMPIFLIFNFARRKVDLDMFAQNLLFTKAIALKAALDMEKGLDRDEARRPAEKRTKTLLTSVPDGIYSEEIRARQLDEVDLLIDHYRRLLRARGSDFPALVVAAYGSREEYLEFLERLKSAESAVTEASLKTLGDRGNPEYVTTLEASIERARSAAVDRIFGAGDADAVPG